MVWEILRSVFDILIPRFISEDVAMEYIGNGRGWEDYRIACRLSDVLPGEQFDGVATVDAFQILGVGITYRIGNFRPWGVK